MVQDHYTNYYFYSISSLNYIYAHKNLVYYLHTNIHTCVFTCTLASFFHYADWLDKHNQLIFGVREKENKHFF